MSYPNNLLDRGGLDLNREGGLDLRDIDPEMLARFVMFMRNLEQQTGADKFMRVGPDGPNGPDGPSQGGPTYPGSPTGTTVPRNSGEWKGSVGGPGQAPLVPNYAPQGVLFSGGSPFPVDDGPAIMQNQMIAIRDIMNSPLGQRAISAIKEKMGMKR